METSPRRKSLVEEVREGLLDDLVEGKLVHGAKLPNESDLARRFRVSRATLREAVLGLLEAGYLARRHGSGTYVIYVPRSRHALETTVSYTAMIREAGCEPGELVVGKMSRAPDSEEREALGLDEGEKVIAVERVRLADGRPVIYSRDRIPEVLLGEIDPGRLDSSLYVVLEWAGHRATRATARLVPSVADTKLARLLDVRRGSPLLHIDQVDFDELGRAVMLSHEWHRADAFDVIVNRRALPAASEY
jgi:GntR family transcriptional regulator